jgi:hypothetical protein
MAVSVRPLGWALVCCLVLPCALSQQLRYAELGNFRLESRAVIRDCRIGFRTFGTLNETRSNANATASAFPFQYSSRHRGFDG